MHRYPLTVLESHLDTFGHVNNAAYLILFEEARWDFITSRGYGLEKIQETGLGPVILEVQIRFHRELRLRQTIIIETEFHSPNKKLATVRQRMVDEQGTIFCHAEFKFGLFDLKKRRLVTPTPEWLKAIQA